MSIASEPTAETQNNTFFEILCKEWCQLKPRLSKSCQPMRFKLIILKKDLDKNLIDSANRKFIFFEYDLNEDGKKEKFVGLTGTYFCGTGGCTQFILDYQGNVITKFTVSGYPIVIDQNKTNGWKDLFIRSGNKDRIVKFDGKNYPSNPSTLPALTLLPGDGLPKALDFTNEPYLWFKF
jgi:hypothetical protein